jgi:Protein of unknown function (DUF2905)
VTFTEWIRVNPNTSDVRVPRTVGAIDLGGEHAMSVSRLLIMFGLALVALGLLWAVMDKIGLGRLPGDIVIERDNFRLYIPLATSLLVSVVFSLLLWLLNR